MMNSRIISLVALIATGVIFFVGCKSIGNSDKASETSNAVYYWRTTLETDSMERAFLQVNDVTRAYVRFFDIVVDKSPIAMDAVVPNATLQVNDTLPVKEVVPTIYITIEAIAKMESNEDAWAEKIVKRVFNMCSYNEIEEPKEIQLDCDWTAKTQSTFFALCQAIKRELQKRNPEAILSATIRLHQLNKPAPPVDYGVLMLYNTGSFKNHEEPNSIISVENVKPYLKYLNNYSLHLDYAYPIFSWDLVYNSDNQFKGLVNSSSNIPDDILIHVTENNYEISKDTIINNNYLYKGDKIRKEDAPFKTIMEVKKLVEQNSRDEHHNVILYQLDTKNISSYSNDEIKQIYK